MEKELTSILYKVFRSTSIKFTDKEVQLIINSICENSVFSAGILISEKYPSLDKEYRLKLLKSTLKDWDAIKVLINNSYFKYCKEYEKKYICQHLSDINIWTKLINELSKDILTGEMYTKSLIKYLKNPKLKDHVDSILMINKLKK